MAQRPGTARRRQTARRLDAALRLRTVGRLASEERGFTLIEVLVALGTSMVVTLALFAILDFATRQETRVTDVAQANQLSRTAMTRIVDELHSACIAPEFKPIQANSNENELMFQNAYSEAAVISEAKQEAYEHRIKFSGGQLVDYSYPSTGGSWPNFTYSSTASPAAGTLLASNVTQSETSGGAKIPVFQYYNYLTTASSGSEAGLSTLSTEPLSAKAPATLGKAAAETAAAVRITFTTGPSDTSGNERERKERSSNLNDQVTLSFSVPRSESTTVDGPCQ
jgi:type II secretory pathway pseudopilin PulG